MRKKDFLNIFGHVNEQQGIFFVTYDEFYFRTHFRTLINSKHMTVYLKSKSLECGLKVNKWDSFSSISHCQYYFDMAILKINVYCPMRNSDQMTIGNMYKQGCALPLVLWPEFRMGQFRVNDFILSFL